MPGEIRKRARVRTGCPGIAASSTSRSWSGLGHWLTQRLQSGDSPNHGSAAGTGKSGTPGERCRTGTVVPTLLAAGKQDERSTNDAARDGWSRAAFVFAEFLRILATDLHGSTPIIKCFELFVRNSVRDLFSRGFHSIQAGLHSFSTIHLALRFVFAYPRRRITTEC